MRNIKYVYYFIREGCFNMGEVYCVAMNKGGVGKTSLITNIASAIVSNKLGKKVLIIDTDGQGNSSLAFGLNPNNFEHTMHDVLIGNKTLDEVKLNIKGNLDFAPANDDMNFLEFDVLTNLKQYPEPFELLKSHIENARKQYDYIFIDTPPSLGLVTGNVLSTSDYVLIPFIPETFAVQGLIRVVKAIKDFREKRNRDLKLAGVVGMMVDRRTALHSEMLQEARKYCEKSSIPMYETIIPRSIRFANSTAYEGKPAVWTNKSNPLVAAYFDLLKEVI